MHRQSHQGETNPDWGGGGEKAPMSLTAWLRTSLVHAIANTITCAFINRHKHDS